MKASKFSQILIDYFFITKDEADRAAKECSKTSDREDAFAVLRFNDVSIIACIKHGNYVQHVIGVEKGDGAIICVTIEDYIDESVPA